MTPLHAFFHHPTTPHPSIPLLPLYDIPQTYLTYALMRVLMGLRPPGLWASAACHLLHLLLASPPGRTTRPCWSTILYCLTAQARHLFTYGRPLQTCNYIRLPASPPPFHLPCLSHGWDANRYPEWREGGSDHSALPRLPSPLPPTSSPLAVSMTTLAYYSCHTSSILFRLLPTRAWTLLWFRCNDTTRLPPTTSPPTYRPRGIPTFYQTPVRCWAGKLYRLWLRQHWAHLPYRLHATLPPMYCPRHGNLITFNATPEHAAAWRLPPSIHCGLTFYLCLTALLLPLPTMDGYLCLPYLPVPAVPSLHHLFSLLLSHRHDPLYHARAVSAFQLHGRACP